MGTEFKPEMMSPIKQSIWILLSIFCAVMSNDVAAQDFLGHHRSLSTSQWVEHVHISRLPVRTLLSDNTFGVSRIGLSYVNGNNRTFQQSKSARNISFSSYGITSFKNIRLEGKFRFLQEQQKDVGWKQGRTVYHQPYYYANIKPGDWDNDRYALNMNGGTTFLNDRLLLALGADYQVERLARYNDPRPEINYHNLFLKAQLGWRFGRHLLAAYAGSGDSMEGGDIRNYDEANDSYGKTEYNIITVMGLGSYDLRQRSEYEKTMNRFETGLTYQYSGTGANLNAEVVYGHKESEFIRREKLNFDNMGIFRENKISALALITLLRNSHTLQVVSDTRFSDGADDNAQYAGSNYFDTRLQQNLRFFFHSRNENISLQVGLGYDDQSIEDRNASHAYDYTRLSANISAQYSKKLGDRRITFIPGLRYTASLSQNLLVAPAQKNMFTRYVLYPDYYLLTSDELGIRGALQIHQNFANLSVALLLDYRRRMVIDKGSLHEEAAFAPGETRNVLSITLQFFH